MSPQFSARRAAVDFPPARSFPRDARTTLLLLAALLARPAAVAAQDSGGRGAELATLRRTLTGRVCLPDGSPAGGALVESSSGGATRAAADGSFALEIELPPDADAVEVSASTSARAGRVLAASARLQPSSLSSLVAAGTLVLRDGSRSRWLPTFGRLPGADGNVAALEVVDVGSGPALYAGGWFSFVGGVAANRIARWDGASWSALGSGMGNGGGSGTSAVLALAAFDDGSGAALYAGGGFLSAGGVAVEGIARWDGSSWSTLGNVAGVVYALAVFDDGGGPALYAGGSFTSAGGVAASNIAKWDGASWSALGSGIDSPVTELVVFDDGGGAQLYAGGSFNTAGGVVSPSLARWDGAGWSTLPGGGPLGRVDALAVFDDGSGASLYAGGPFSRAGTRAARRIARWDGSGWWPVGGGLDFANESTVRCLRVFDDGGGPALYAGGTFTWAGGVFANQIAKWDGASWSALGDGADDSNNAFTSVEALAPFDEGDGPVLLAGGDFRSVGGVGARALSRWDGERWKPFGTGVSHAVHALAVSADAGGPVLHVGGELQCAGGVPGLNGVGAWDGSHWSRYHTGVGGTVSALAIFDSAGGPALHAGGDFTSVDGVAWNRIAAWNGASWSALANGITEPMQRHVDALAVFDDGGGPALYVGGKFMHASGVLTPRLGRWDGAGWSMVGNGMEDDVYALAVLDTGAGPALYAGGDFNAAGGVPASCVARWDGASWSALGSGLSGRVRALAVFDGGNGPEIVAAGDFLQSGASQTVNHVARFDGTAWSPLGVGLDGAAHALAVFDDGGGPELYVGGAFTSAGGLAASRIARWDGASWSALGAGLPGTVRALTTFGEAGDLSLIVGGEFVDGPAGDSFLARFGRDRLRGGRR